MANSPVALGASAAVNAIVMLQVMLYPREMIYIYMVLPIPAAAFGLLYIFGDMFGMLGVSKSPSTVFCIVVLCRHMQYVLIYEQCICMAEPWWEQKAKRRIASRT